MSDSENISDVSGGESEGETGVSSESGGETCVSSESGGESEDVSEGETGVSSVSGGESEGEKSSDKSENSNNTGSSDDDIDDIDDFMFDISKLNQNFDRKVREYKPIFSRKLFPFSFWYMSSVDSKGLENLRKHTINNIKNVIKVDKIQLYIIQGENEKDRLRVICLNIIVDKETALDLRWLILSSLEYTGFSNIIPSMMYELPITPKIFMPTLWDNSLEKWGDIQKFKCLNENLTSEEIEKIFVVCLNLDDCDKLVKKFTSKYNDYLSTREAISTVLSNKSFNSTVLFDKEISENIKKELKKYYNLCVGYFKKFHPDSTLRNVKKIGNDIYCFDFTKSDYECKICKVLHNSNRQYLTFSKNNKTANYYCYDTEANGKKKIISFHNK